MECAGYNTFNPADLILHIPRRCSDPIMSPLSPLLTEVPCNAGLRGEPRFHSFMSSSSPLPNSAGPTHCTRARASMSRVERCIATHKAIPAPSGHYRYRYRVCTALLFLPQPTCCPRRHGLDCRFAGTRRQLHPSSEVPAQRRQRCVEDGWPEAEEGVPVIIPDSSIVIPVPIAAEVCFLGRPL